MFDGAFSAWHLLIVAGVVVVLFGSKKLPDAARSMGRSLRIFKAEVKELRADDTERPSVIDSPTPVETTAAADKPTD